MKRNGRTPKTDRTRGTYNKIIRFSNPHLDTLAVVIQGGACLRKLDDLDIYLFHRGHDMYVFLSNE